MLNTSWKIQDSTKYRIPSKKCCNKSWQTPTVYQYELKQAVKQVQLDVAMKTANHVRTDII